MSSPGAPSSGTRRVAGALLAGCLALSSCSSPGSGEGATPGATTAPTTAATSGVGTSSPGATTTRGSGVGSPSGTGGRTPVPTLTATPPLVTPPGRRRPTASVTTDSTGAIDLVTSGSYGFTTPSGDITCLLDAGRASGEDATARCAIGEHTWPAPKRPPSCPLGDGTDLYVSAGRSAGFTCAGDTIAGTSAAQVAHGTTIRLPGALRCEVQKAGVTCVSLRTRKGFSLARTSYRIF